jgi:hypothetical protein
MTSSDRDGALVGAASGSSEPATPPAARDGRSHATTQPGEVPDFYIVGHPKCGTTALYEMLRRHPQIYMPELKETRFFARELHPRSPPSLPASLDAYLALFDAAGPHQRVGEASPSYLRSHAAARRIAELRPDASVTLGSSTPSTYATSSSWTAMRRCSRESRSW